jgi:Ca2+-binding EF-hand superfamily protein
MMRMAQGNKIQIIIFRSINFDKVKKIAKELGETMNDEELEEMMHHIHVLKKTEVPNEINFDEFYEIITAPRRY